VASHGVIITPFNACFEGRFSAGKKARKTIYYLKNVAMYAGKLATDRRTGDDETPNAEQSSASASALSSPAC
jgi:hypothetical protein